MSIAFLADEDFNQDILRGVRQRYAEFDVVTAQEAGLTQTPDAQILEWAARHSRLILTHDISTMKMHAVRRIEMGLPMPGMFILPRRAALTAFIDEIILIARCSDAAEWSNMVIQLPLD